VGSGFLFYPGNARPQFLNISQGEERRGLDFAILTSDLHSVSGKVDLPSPNDRFWLALSALDQPALAVAVTQSDADGSFRFNGVPAGSYHLFASRTSGSRGWRGGTLAADPVFARTRVDLVSQDVADLTVLPAKGRSMAFVMRVATPSGSGAVCPRTAQLVLKPLEDWGAELDRLTSMSLEKEETLSKLAPSRYVVSVTGLGDTCYSTANPVVDLSGAAEAGPFVVTIAAAGSIRGKLDAGGQSSSRFAIVLLAVEAGDSTPAVQIALPDAESQFTFVSLRPGRYRIAAVPAAEASQSRWLSEPERMVEVEVRGAAASELTLTAPSADAKGPGRKP
jgi:hypothetical protein